MSDRVLPDDPRDWPRDPFELLGVARTVDEKAIRRAYSQLIRRYKPEQSPAEFQKIRQAYDEARERIHWQQFVHVDPEESNDGEVSASLGHSPANGQDSDEGVASPELPELRHPVDPMLEVRAAWNRAREGQWTEAWLRLLELNRQMPDSDEVSHRLHWLRTLRPDLDGTVPSPREGAALRVPPTPTLRSMFLDRMRSNFDLAYSEEAEAWWTAPLPLWEQQAFLRARWGAAAGKGEPGFARIEADLERAGMMFRHERGMWFQTLVRAVELSYLGRGEEAVSLRRRAEELLERERDLELQFSRLLESLDLLSELARHMKDFATSREEGLMTLALRGLIGEEGDCRDELVAEIVAWAQSPADGLDLLDRIAGRHPAFASLLRDRVENYVSERGMDSDPPDGDRLVRVVAEEADLIAALNRFSLLVESDDGAEVRRRLLALSLREGVRLSHLIEALREMPSETIHNVDLLCSTLHRDAPLATVTNGCLALWNV